MAQVINQVFSDEKSKNTNNSIVVQMQYINAIILDLTQVQFIDESGVKILKEIML